MAEIDLYAPVKKFLEAQGYVVKGEIADCDVVAVRGDEPPVVVELKDSLNLALILQAVDRLRISNAVYVAFRVGKGKSATWRSRHKQVISLFRRLGVGILTVSARGRVEPVLDPAPYKPRADAPRKRRLLKEFAERVGDPHAGGSASGERFTAYRQDALLCGEALAAAGVLKVSEVREQTGIDRAGAIFTDNHYGWFDRVKRGHYELSPKGREDVHRWRQLVEEQPG